MHQNGGLDGGYGCRPGKAQAGPDPPNGLSTARSPHVALIVLAPLFAMVAMLILVTSGLPIFYTPEARGAGGPSVPYHQVPQHAVRRRERNWSDLGVQP